MIIIGLVNMKAMLSRYGLSLPLFNLFIVGADLKLPPDSYSFDSGVVEATIILGESNIAIYINSLRKLLTVLLGAGGDDGGTSWRKHVRAIVIDIAPSFLYCVMLRDC